MPDAGYMIRDDKAQSYKDLAIFSIAKELSVKIHMLTLKELPRLEMYEEDSQIRRSSKSIIANIVEGFGRRRYKNEFIQYLTYAVASCDETKAHLDILHETGSLKKDSFRELMTGYEELCAKLFKFREAVIKGHRAS